MACNGSSREVLFLPSPISSFTLGIKIRSSRKTTTIMAPTPINGYLHDNCPSKPPIKGPAEMPIPTAASNNRIDLALAIPAMVMIAVSPVAKKRELPIPQSPRSPTIVQILFANPARDANVPIIMTPKSKVFLSPNLVEIAPVISMAMAITAL